MIPLVTVVQLLPRHAAFKGLQTQETELHNEYCRSHRPPIQILFSEWNTLRTE